MNASIAMVIGRLIVGSFYLFYAAQQVIWFGFWTGYATAKGVPLAPLAVIIGALLLTVGGLSLITGLWPRLGMGAIVLFLVPVSLYMHNFWAVQGLEQTIELASFTKNLALAGSALICLALPQPWAFSLGRRPADAELGRPRLAAAE